MSQSECTCSRFVRNVRINNSNLPEHYNTCAIVLKKRQENGEFPYGLPRNADGVLKFQNPNLSKIKHDYLYHLALDNQTYDLQVLFGDVKFVCMGGTTHRMEQLANMAVKELGIELPPGCGIIDMTAASHRYCLYKVGPVMTVNHGIGICSFSVVFQEIIKLLQYSRIKDPMIIRVGTSGGINVEPGTVVISNKGYNGMLEETYDLPVLGKMVSWPVVLDQLVAEEFRSMSEETDGFETIIGGTMCANDFYNGQSRIDGAFCDYTEIDKLKFLNKLKDKGIKNIEMEVTCLGALTHRAGIKAVDICITFLDRLKGDQVTTPKDILNVWLERPMIIVFRYITKYLKSIGRLPYGKS